MWVYGISFFGAYIYKSLNMDPINLKIGTKSILCYNFQNLGLHNFTDTLCALSQSVLVTFSALCDWTVGWVLCMAHFIQRLTFTMIVRVDLHTWIIFVVFALWRGKVSVKVSDATLQCCSNWLRLCQMFFSTNINNL